MGSTLERAHSNFQIGMALFLSLGLEILSAIASRAQPIPSEALANDLKNNVVRIVSRSSDGSPRSGFGFVVGERFGLIYIVTADHVVRDSAPTPSAPGLYFFKDQGKEYRGDLLATRLPPGSGDVAVIRTQPPPGFSWRRDVLARVSPRRGDDVWFIGLGEQWFVPARPGAVGSVEPSTIRFEQLSVRYGTSGAPLIARTGIVGLVVRDADVYAEATPIEVIDRAIRDWQYPWDLKESISATAPPPIVPTLPNPLTPGASSNPPNPPPPTTHIAANPPLSDYRTRDNRDIWLSDILLPDGNIGMRNVDIDECAKQCTGNSRCLGFSFDRWNKTCYLKSKVSDSILDPHSVIAVKKPAEIPKVSQQAAVIEILRDRRMKGPTKTSKIVANFPACKSACEGEIKCIAFNFLKESGRSDNCELYQLVSDHVRDASVDSGYKRQVR